MKLLLAAVNAKYIHTSLAVRLLYLACRDRHNASFAEYTVKDSPERIEEDLLRRGCRVIGFSCYIWNITLIEQLVRQIKAASPETIILLGGPEVTYDPEHFLQSCPADFVIQGEGEEILPTLLDCLEAGEAPAEISLPGVSRPGRIAPEVLQCSLPYVESLGSPYTLPEDEADKGKRVLYFESSRGCPYRCRYCLSSLEEGMRYFGREYLERELADVCRSGAKTVKFLDRSFCARPDHAIAVLKTIFDHAAPGMQFQFEINADTMPERVLNYVIENAPPGLLRFEVGVQSTYEPANRAVGRIQDFEKLSRTVRALQESGKFDLHLDLIAGLPFETFERFAQTFDEVFDFHGKELQLGFLKLLRGTELRSEAEKYGFEYCAQPPYELMESTWMSAEELKKLRLAAEMLERYGNSGRFPTVLPAIWKTEPSPFRFFLRLGEYYREKGFPESGYQVHELFECLDTFTGGHYHTELMQDYFPLFRVRPKRWYEPSLMGAEKKRVLNAISRQYGLSPELLFRYTVIEQLSDRYMLVIYKDMSCSIQYFDKAELVL